MSDEVLVKVEGVSKKFCRSLKRNLWYGVQDVAVEMFGRRGSHDELRKSEFWAVNDVSFELKRGECLEDVIEFLPTFKDALNLIGECYERIGEGAKAEHYYLKAISADPDGIIIHGGVLDGHAREKKREERIKH